MNTYKVIDLRVPKTIIVRLTTSNEGLFSEDCYFLPLAPYNPGDEILLDDLTISQSLARMYFNAGTINPEYRYMLPFRGEGDYNGYSAENMAKIFVATDLMGEALAKYRGFNYGGIPPNIYFHEDFAALINKLHPKNT